MTVYVPAHAPWAYRPNAYDDWGTIRDREGLVVVRASMGRYTEDELDAHRRAGTDPTERTCREIIRAFNCHDSLVAGLREAESSLTAVVAELDLPSDGPNAKALEIVRAALAKAEAI